MEARFLDSIPSSGDYLERSYEPTLECAWVLFEPSSTEAWVGAFGLGSSDCRQVHQCGNTPVFLVLANGNPYLVDCETGDLVSDPIQGDGDITAALSVPGRDLIIAADHCQLLAVNSRGSVWESPIVAIDGIDLLEVTSGELLGHLHTEDGVYRFTLRFQDWHLLQGAALEEYFGETRGIFTGLLEGLRIRRKSTLTAPMFSAPRSKKLKIQHFLHHNRGCWVALLVLLVAVSALLVVPVNGYRFDSGYPTVLSNAESGIIIVPAWTWTSRARVTQILWCGFLGYWGPVSCLPERRATGLHIWFLRASGVEYQALEPFPNVGEAYLFDGNLRWQSGRETWEWVDHELRKLSELEGRLPYRDQRSLEEMLEAEGWFQHPLENERQTFSLGPYRVRYTRPSIDDGPTEIVIEEGPTVVGTLFSRHEEWHFTWWTERIPEFSVQNQQPTE